MLHMVCPFRACKFGFCVVAHPPNAQIFLLLRRGLFYVDAWELLDISYCSNHGIEVSVCLLGWRRQLDSIEDTEFVDVIKMASLLLRVLHRLLADVTPTTG